MNDLKEDTSSISININIKDVSNDRLG